MTDELHITSCFISDASKKESNALLVRPPYILTQTKVRKLTDSRGRSRYCATVADDKDTVEVMFSDDVGYAWEEFLATHAHLGPLKGCAICIQDYFPSSGSTKIGIVLATWDLRLPIVSAVQKPDPVQRAAETLTNYAQSLPATLTPTPAPTLPVLLTRPSQPKPMTVGTGEKFNGDPIILISTLSPAQRQFSLHVRVSKGGQVRPFRNGNGQLLSVELEDSSGTIRATLFGSAADQYKPFLTLGANLYINNIASIKKADEQYKTASSPFELTFNENTVIRIAPQPPFQGPSIERYSIIPVEKAITDRSLERKKVDLVGVVVGWVPELREFTSAKGFPMKERALSMADITGASIKLKILGDFAATLALPWREEEHLDGETVLEEGSIAILAKGVEIGEYKGEKTYTVAFSPTVKLVDLGSHGPAMEEFNLIAQKTPEVAALAHWHANFVQTRGADKWMSTDNPREAAFRHWVRSIVHKKNPTLSTFLGRPLGIYSRYDTIGQAMEQLEMTPHEPVFFSAMVHFQEPRDMPAKTLKDGQTWAERPALRSFYSCPKCRGRATREHTTDRFFCAKCNNSFDEAPVRCDLKAQMVDRSYAGSAHLFHEAAMVTMGMDKGYQGELEVAVHAPEKRAAIYHDMRYLPIVVSAKLSMQVRDDQLIPSIAVTEATRPDWAMEAGLLVEKIKILQEVLKSQQVPHAIAV